MFRRHRSWPPARAVVLVTGSSSGIGRATVAELAAAGFGVIAAVRNPEDGHAVERVHPRRIQHVTLDLAQPDTIAPTVAVVRDLLAGRPLHGVVLNAGIALPAPVALVRPEELRRHFEVNVFGHLFLLQGCLPLMDAAAGPGHVVVVSSVSGRLADPFLGAYAASKHALEALASSLRREVPPSRLRVTIVEPGAVRTPIWRKGTGVDLTVFDGTAYAGPLQRFRAAMLDEAASGCGPEAVAVAIRRSLTSGHHRRRRFVSARRHRYYRLLPLLPAGVYDRLCAQVLGAPGTGPIATEGAREVDDLR